jgi:protein-disulfide isomerase
MTRKTAVLVLAALVIVIGGAFLFIPGLRASFGGGGGGVANLLAQGPGAQAVDIKPTDMVHGSANAPVTIVEYASMTCSHCAAFQKDVVPQLTKDYIDTGKVKLVFREYPLDGAAAMASATARCMTGDNYFNFIDLLFRNQAEWIKDFDGNQQLTKEDVEEGLTQMGRRAGMGRDQVLKCANDPKNTAIVTENWQEGQNRYKVEATPTFVINGKVHAGEISYDALKAMIDPVLANK